MSWRQSLFPVLILVLAGCAIGPPATPTPTTAQSVAEALRMAAEGGLPLDLIHIRYEIGSEAWQGRTVLDIDGSGAVQVTSACQADSASDTPGPCSFPHP